MSSWVKEPLFHFLLIGAGVFLLYGLTANVPKEEHNSIDVSASRADRMVTLWEKRWNRLPTQEEFDGLTDQYINEEVLYREALAMGLDSDDPVVRRRLAQKVKFISNDIISIDAPTKQQLQTYLDTHASQYQLPGKVTFQHIYFNPAKHNALMEEEAEQLLAKFIALNIGSEVDDVGDSFLHGTAFKDIKEFEVNRLFGKKFTQMLFEQPAGKWVGPMVSSYGLHLIYIESKNKAQTASLVQARDSVLEDWMSDERKKANESFLTNLRKQYEVVISKPSQALLSEKSSK